MTRVGLTATAVALALVTTGASAATLTITSITGLWENDVPDEGVAGEGTQEITWGEPFGQPNPSAYRFDGATTPIIDAEADTEIALGTFTHFNRPIITEDFLRTVDLEVSIGIDGLDRPITTVFSFEHNETDNRLLGDFGDPDPSATCENGERNTTGINVNGCADRVVATRNDAASETFVIDNIIYAFDITGFRVGGETLTEFWTEEHKDNEAVLVGTFRQIGVIPLPAAGWLLLAGLGGLAGLRRAQHASA